MPSNPEFAQAVRIGNVKRIYQHLSRFSTFARYTYRNARNRGQLCYCFAAALKWPMPFAPAQTRSYHLTSTLGAMDAITTVEGHREQAVSPTFVNIIGDGRSHASPPQSGNAWNFRSGCPRHRCTRGARSHSSGDRMSLRSRDEPKNGRADSAQENNTIQTVFGVVPDYQHRKNIGRQCEPKNRSVN
jgi:hypothetical protein